MPCCCKTTISFVGANLSADDGGRQPTSQKKQTPWVLLHWRGTNKYREKGTAPAKLSPELSSAFNVPPPSSASNNPTGCIVRRRPATTIPFVFFFILLFFLCLSLACTASGTWRQGGGNGNLPNVSASVQTFSFLFFPFFFLSFLLFPLGGGTHSHTHTHTLAYALAEIRASRWRSGTRKHNASTRGPATTSWDPASCFVLVDKRPFPDWGRAGC